MKTIENYNDLRLAYVTNSCKLEVTPITKTKAIEILKSKDKKESFLGHSPGDFYFLVKLYIYIDKKQYQNLLCKKSIYKKDNNLKDLLYIDNSMK